MYSKEYIEQLQSLHSDKSRPQGFGGKPKKLGKFHDYIKLWKPTSILDYGCGKGYILASLRERYPNIICDGYDPAVSMFNKIPRPNYECIFSNDVLEHVEPKMINAVLQNINDIALKYVWLRIDTLPARKVLPDGRNAHLIIQNKEWWEYKIKDFINGEILYSNLDRKGKLDFAIERSYD